MHQVGYPQSLHRPPVSFHSYDFSETMYTVDGKPIWKFLKKLKIKLPYPAIPLLGIYPKERISGSECDTCTDKFITALFTRAKIWKQP